MVCILCLAAVAAISAAVLGPDVINDLLNKLRGVLPDVRTISESSSVAKWEGTYNFTERGKAIPIPVALYVYKRQKRLRIQILTHSLDRPRAEFVESTIADALGVSIVARSFPETVPIDGDEHEDRLVWQPVEGLPSEPQSTDAMS